MPITIVILKSVTFVIKLKIMVFEQLHQEYKENSISGRYIALQHIEDLLLNDDRKHRTKVDGTSVEGRPIYSYTIGTGTIRILMWSQMHGNESTATKSIFDLLNLLDSDTEVASELLQHFTFRILPLVNPDGAFAYTRLNANQIDLNRDFVNLTQPESTVLKNVCLDFQPHYCFNLHDQRTIFGAGQSGKPATISFLSPSFNETLEINQCRIKAIQVINTMNAELQKSIPGQIGRFDDAFNLNCVGDNFQNMGFPTILIEAGHESDDYCREKVRQYVFTALVAGFLNLDASAEEDDAIEKYLNIPENLQNFRDIIYKNVSIFDNGVDTVTNIAIQYKEVLIGCAVQLIACISDIGTIETLYGHKTIDVNGARYSDKLINIPKIDQIADFSLDKVTNVVNGLIKM